MKRENLKDYFKTFDSQSDQFLIAITVDVDIIYNL